MTNIKLFETTQDYTSAQLVLPNVSLCKDAPTKVYYNPSSNS